MASAVYYLEKWTVNSLYYVFRSHEEDNTESFVLALHLGFERTFRHLNKEKLEALLGNTSMKVIKSKHLIPLMIKTHNNPIHRSRSII